MSDKTTHFGYQEVPESEKARKVEGVFTSVAQRYDVMNDLMSAGLHRLWKRFAIDQSYVRKGERVLDVAGGTADLERADGLEDFELEPDLGRLTAGGVEPDERRTFSDELVPLEEVVRIRTDERGEAAV